MTTLTNEELAEIEKRHADCEAFYAGHGGYRPDWHKDRATLLAKLRATSQAEAPLINESIYWSKEDTYDAPPTTTETNSNE